MSPHRGGIVYAAAEAGRGNISAVAGVDTERGGLPSGAAAHAHLATTGGDNGDRRGDLRRPYRLDGHWRSDPLLAITCAGQIQQSESRAAAAGAAWAPGRW